MARVLQQHQRQQAHHLRLGLVEPQQQPPQPDRFLRQRDLGLTPRVTFVEDEIDHGGDGPHALSALNRTRRLEGHAGPGDPGLGAGNPLFHRRLTDQKRAGDLLHREAGNDPEGQGDLVAGLQVGVATDKQQPQDVIAIVAAVEPFDDLFLHVLQIRQRLLRRQVGQPRPLAHPVQGGVATDHDQPGGRIARRAILRPVGKSAQTGVLKRLLGDVEIAEIAQQSAYRLGPRGGDRRLDPGRIGHATLPPGRNSRIGRISYEPPGLARPRSRAISSASSRFPQSTT